MKKVFLMRADASSEMGAGHIMRTLALGQMLQDEDCEVHFATIAHNSEMIKCLIAEKFSVHLLNAPFSEDADARSLSHIARSISASWIVVDGYHFSGKYENIVKNEVPSVKILAIDDVPRTHHVADILLSQNFGAQNMGFSAEGSTQKLLGLEFLLLRREFKKARSEAKAKCNSKHIPKRLLVTLGGGTLYADIANLKIARALYDFDTSQLEIVYIAGKMSTNKNAIKNLLTPNNYFIEFSDNMAREMSRSDFAIVAGGSSMWELMYMGVPFLAVALTEAQKSYIEMLAQHRLCINLGSQENLESSQVRSAVTQLMGDPKLQKEYRCRYADLVKPENLGKRLLQTLLSDI